MRKFKIKLGIILIACSLIIIAFGFSLGLKTTTAKKDVLKDSSFINLPDTNVTVDDSVNNDLDANEDESFPEINNYEQVPKADESNSLEASVESLRSKIQNTYNISVLIGDEVKDYTVGGYSIITETELNVIYNGLMQLDQNLALYPPGFFDEIKNGGLPLSIYLIKNYSSGNVTGITEKLKNEIVISLSLDYPFAESFNHEIYHYMEHYISLKGGGYTNWNNYNPTGFSYGTFDQRYVYDSTLSDSAFFVNSYSQSYEYEDRASTFEYMMADTKISPLNYGNNIWKKAKIICETIDYYFSTVSSKSTEYWERFIY